MLSKAQARWFFVGGTVLFSCLFLFLTVDTVRKVPEQTNHDQLTESAIRGKHLWDVNNCMGCHTLLGEGAYYAPELTKVIERRGKEWIAVFLKDPQAMFPGERKMVQYDFSDQDIADLIEFFDWIGKMDLNGFPADPPLAQANLAGKPATNEASATAMAKPAKFALCGACHAIAGQGGTVGPALDGVGDRFDLEYLKKWISDPQAVKPGTAMPKLPLTEEELNEMAEFLSTLKSGGNP